MEMNEIMRTKEVLQVIRAISAVNKEDMETLSARLNLDSAIQLNILWIVYCSEGVRITDIADWTFWHTSSIVVHVKKLMEKGYVTLEKNEQDGRVVNVFMTESGQEFIRKSLVDVPAIFKLTQALNRMSERYSPKLTYLFIELLDFLAQDLQGEDKVTWLKSNEDKVLKLLND